MEEQSKVNVTAIKESLTKGLGVLRHDSFISIVGSCIEDNKESFIVIIPHYLDNICGIDDDEDFESVILNSEPREITFVVENGEITYNNGHLKSVIPFNITQEEVLNLFRSLKFINYKDSGFVTALIGEDGNFLKSSGILISSN
ncbi:hypothetical protein KAJ41_02295 [Candidatus Parcubacteria bacterium]|nr:hypothetical protein [Candidatus Parcubacteria bacterium]